MQYFYVLLFILGIQSCLTEDLAVKKKVSVKPTPKIDEAIQRDLGEVRITEKKIDKLIDYALNFVKPINIIQAGNF